TDPSGCPILVQQPGTAGCLRTPDAGPRDPVPVVAAIIDLSHSTNSPEIDVTVDVDGSAVRTVGASTTNILNVGPMTWPANSPDVETFLADLKAVGDVSAIPTAPCPKSASFGTTTKIVVDG